ncbi:MAG: 23S rRNA (adenine(2503)-C(2))-methyltransferase RlmN [Bacteriovoracaceae bacterium]|nr:23S rRNA (adenine(2503)-C(2))-methyltransferase RlmN [Bacteriovoracaceae bacterium]
MRSIFSFTLSEMREYLVEHGCAKFAADQVYQWLYKHHEIDIDKWTNISKKIKEHFRENISFKLPEVVFHIQSTDGTRKFLLELDDGNTVETVAIPAQGRLTQCISSQVGCAMGCLFCNTGTMGFIRHLTVAEVVGQYMAVTKWVRENGDDPEIRISNLVYMGQGEPLHNFDNMLQATKVFMEEKGLAIGGRKITLSTSGLVPQIKKLNDFPAVNLAVSLHSTFDEKRSQLMPVNDKWGLTKLFEALNSLELREFRFITYEYLLIADFNDRPEDIAGLCRLLDTKSSKINLIPYNEFPGSPYKRPDDEKIEWFKNQLLKKGHVCTTRASKGSDIMAACGQLKSKEDKKNRGDESL